jgi:hypothetical protein
MRDGGVESGVSDDRPMQGQENHPATLTIVKRASSRGTGSGGAVPGGARERGVLMDAGAERRKLFLEFFSAAFRAHVRPVRARSHQLLKHRGALTAFIFVKRHDLSFPVAATSGRRSAVRDCRYRRLFTPAATCAAVRLQSRFLKNLLHQAPVCERRLQQVQAYERRE